MAYVTLDIPPGLYRNGTDYTAKGRWLNANLRRWFSGEQRPVGGWTPRSKGVVAGRPRAMIAWKTNAAKSWAAIGTHSHLYAMTAGGYLNDITPAGFAGGRPDAWQGGVYGLGPYGGGDYGRGAGGGAVTIDASQWVLDTWGETLVGVMAEDGRIHQWTLSPDTPAAPVAGAPAAGAVVVTAERIMMALGANGDPRQVAWSDREDNTAWTETDTNYAGSFPLQTAGKLMCGRRVAGGTLLLTDADAWLATFEGQPLVYGFAKVGAQCGIVSRGAIVTTDVQAYWMSSNGFWMFNGYSQPIPCDVHDHVFSTLDTSQASKVAAVHVSAFGEVWWFYPSTAGTGENDSYVVFNYREAHWNCGQLARLCGIDRGPFGYPMMCDAAGQVWDHESGVDHQGLRPFAESGPVELGAGDRILMVRRIIPDTRTLGDISMDFTLHNFPNDLAPSPPSRVEVPVLGPQTDVRFSARAVSMKLTGADGSDFRVGTFRFDVVERGQR